MAAKVHPPQDNTGTSVLSQMPPSVSLASSILASNIPLPDHPLIAYSVFSPLSANGLECLELARRVVLRQNKDKTFLVSLLPVVHVAKDVCALYVFAIGSTHRLSDAHGVLGNLQFENLKAPYNMDAGPRSTYEGGQSAAGHES
ncbi:hypothetical protein FKP32DRAFT_57752 [Trametes sanguinea]|nr:hypothetical protein FKP32DRAFT_57752 [Trametes sanguinea]